MSRRPAREEKGGSSHFESARTEREQLRGGLPAAAVRCIEESRRVGHGTFRSGRGVGSHVSTISPARPPDEGGGPRPGRDEPDDTRTMRRPSAVNARLPRLVNAETDRDFVAVGSERSALPPGIRGRDGPVW